MADFIEELSTIAPNEVAKNAARAESFQQARVKDNKNKFRLAAILAGAFFVSNLMTTSAIFVLVPTLRIRPIFLLPHFDSNARFTGVIDTFDSLKDFSPSERKVAVEALLWQYVRNREHYNFPESKNDFEIVNGMSSQTVANRYAQWYNESTDSPQKKLGREGFRTVSRVSGAFISNKSDYSSGTYQIRYAMTTVAKQNAKPVEQRMAVTLSYITQENISLWDMVRFNPGQIVIVSYPYPETEGS